MALGTRWGQVANCVTKLLPKPSLPPYNASETLSRKGRVMAALQCRNGSWRIIFRHGGKQHSFMVGEVPEVQADGRWHSVQFDLQPSWHALMKRHRNEGGLTRPRGLRAMLGNLDNQGYLLAGMNANHAGAAYSISTTLEFRLPKTRSLGLISKPGPLAAAVSPTPLVK